MNEQIRLIPVEETTRGGNIHSTPKYNDARSVYARASSVGSREFFDSLRAGIELSARFEVWRAEYQDEKLVQWHGDEYRVVRTYHNDAHQTVELICEKLRGR